MGTICQFLAVVLRFGAISANRKYLLNIFAQGFPQPDPAQGFPGGMPFMGQHFQPPPLDLLTLMGMAPPGGPPFANGALDPGERILLKDDRKLWNIADRAMHHFPPADMALRMQALAALQQQQPPFPPFSMMQMGDSGPMSMMMPPPMPPMSMPPPPKQHERPQQQQQNPALMPPEMMAYGGGGSGIGPGSASAMQPAASPHPGGGGSGDPPASPERLRQAVAAFAAGVDAVLPGMVRLRGGVRGETVSRMLPGTVRRNRQPHRPGSLAGLRSISICSSPSTRICRVAPLLTRFPSLCLPMQGMAAAGQMSIAQLLNPSSAPIPAHLLPPPHLLAQPGLMPPGIMPGFLAPGLLPPGLMPSGLMPPGLMAPGLMAPGMMPSGLLPPGLMPPGLMPPGMLPPGLLPPGALAPLAGLPGLPTHHQRVVAPQQLLAAAAALQAAGGSMAALPALLQPQVGGLQYLDDTVNKRMKRKQSNRCDVPPCETTACVVTTFLSISLVSLQEMS